MRFGGALIASAAFLTASAAAAQSAADDEPICADRPGKADGTCTVSAGMVQIETGIADWIHDRSGGVRTDELAVGETAVKLGVTDRLHVQLTILPYSSVRVREGGLSERVSGFGDLGLAAKYRLTEDSAPVQVAMLPFLKIPTAKRSLGNGKLEGGIVVPIDYEFPGSPVGLTLSPEIDINADSDGSGRHLAMVQAVSLGVPLSSRLSVAVDLWGEWDWDPAGTSRQYSIGPSAAYLLSNDAQVDAGFDGGLNRQAPDVQVYAGIAFRF
ncbi:MAG: transporter [Sphingomicrobium sp.]